MKRSITEKKCSKCKEIKPLALFSWREGNKSYDYCCKTCNSDRLKEWKKNNKDKVALQKKRSVNGKLSNRVRKNKRRTLLIGSFTSAQWIELCSKYNNKCLCCKKELPLTIDHVKPVSKGGSNSIENIQPLCMPCNRYKGIKEIDYRQNAFWHTG